MPAAKSRTPADKPAPKLLKVREAAALCGVTADTIRNWRGDPTFPAAVVINGRLLFVEAELIAWLETKRARRGRVADAD